MEASKFKLDSPHIAAEIYYLSYKEGGMQTPIHSGYRGQFRINNSDWDAIQEFIDTESCNPGNSVKTYIKFATLHQIIPLTVGSTFEIREGNMVVGKGVITVIIDKDILQHSSRREYYKWIDKIIWNQWDPIGVNEFEEARDEYYSYLPNILSLAIKNGNREIIAEHLNKIEIVHMGLVGDYQKCLLVADKILEFNQ